MIKYHTAMPFFPEGEVDTLVSQFREILEGKRMLSAGSAGTEFEQEFSSYVNTQHAVAVSSCTAALEICLRILDLSADDEVVVPVETFIATGTAVLRAGGKVAFANIDANTFCLSLATIKAAVTRHTKAVIVVHMAGYITPEIQAIKEYCDAKGIVLIEDCAHAHGATLDGRFAGSIGVAGCFSFYPTKILTTAEGGMITTNDQEFHGLADSYRHRGRVMDSPVELYQFAGTNDRLSEVSSLMGLSQLRCLDDFLAARRQVAEVYNQAFKGLFNGQLLLQQEKNEGHSYWRYLLKVPTGVDREVVRDSSREAGIAVDWSYVPALHLQPVFKDMEIDREALEPSVTLLDQFICLPIHQGLSVEDAEIIAVTVAEIIKDLA